MQTASHPHIVTGDQATPEPDGSPDRLPLRVAVPLLGMASLALWWGLWRGVSALL